MSIHSAALILPHADRRMDKRGRANFCVVNMPEKYLQLYVTWGISDLTVEVLLWHCLTSLVLFRFLQPVRLKNVYALKMFVL
jgi:hypothetical protein